VVWFAKTPADREINNIPCCHPTTVLLWILTIFCFAGLCFGMLVRLFRGRRILVLALRQHSSR
jgi:hypothetical protein